MQGYNGIKIDFKTKVNPLCSKYLTIGGINVKKETISVSV